MGETIEDNHNKKYLISCSPTIRISILHCQMKNKTEYIALSRDYERTKGLVNIRTYVIVYNLQIVLCKSRLCKRLHTDLLVQEQL